MRCNFFLSPFSLSFIMIPHKLKVLYGGIIITMETVLHAGLGCPDAACCRCALLHPSRNKCCFIKSLYMIHQPKRRANQRGHLAAIPGHPIGWADGPDLTIPDHFAKNPRPLQKSTCSPAPLSGNFSKKPSTFIKINPQSNLLDLEKFANKTLSFC
jgi:hypothetical protein